MALPYHMPPVSSPLMPMNEYYRHPATSFPMMQQIQCPDDIRKRVYQNMHDMFYPLTHGYGLSWPPGSYIARPSVQDLLVPPPSRLGFPEGMMPFPGGIYPNTKLPTTPKYVPTRSYLSELKSAAERLAASDARAQAVEAPDGAAESSRPAGGYELALAHDPSLGQHFAFGMNYKPGRGQQYISRIRSLVEGIPMKEPKPRTVTRRKRKSRPKSGSQSPTNSDHPSTSPESKKRRNSATIDVIKPSKHLRTHWYPRPVSSTCDHLYIGQNGTFVPTQFYASIPWHSCEESARLLMEFIFDDGSLATHNLEGENPLDPTIIDDVITHVAEKCFLQKANVRSIIAKICADAAIKLGSMVGV